MLSTLTAAQYTNTFSYDTYGRLTSSGLGSSTYGDSTHLHAATAAGSNGQGGPYYTASYDAAGDMTCRAASPSTTCSGTQTGAQLSYDNEQRLVSWQNAPSSPSSTDAYLYDGDGDRVAQQVTSGLPGSPVTTTTVYVGNIAESATTGSSTTTTTYYYAGTLRIAVAVGGPVSGTLSYLCTDALGSTTVALSGSGTGSVTADQLYGPYGGGRYQSGTMPTDYGYTGQHADSATGLDYYNARYYDPVLSQFISADTTIPGGGYDPWGLSHYAYVEGNPETRTDPTGRWTLGLCGGGTAGIPGLGFFASGCIVGGWDPKAGWSGGLTGTVGGPGNAGLGGLGVNGGLQFSNAPTVDNLAGYFGYLGLGGALGPAGAYGTGFVGLANQATTIFGGDAGWQAGLDFDIHGGVSFTKVLDFSTIENWVGQKAAAATKWVGQQLGKARDWIGQQLSNGRDWVNKQLNNARNWLSQKVQSAESWLSSAWSGATSALSSAWSGATSTIGSTWSGATSALGSAWSRFTSWW